MPPRKFPKRQGRALALCPFAFPPTAIIPTSDSRLPIKLVLISKGSVVAVIGKKTGHMLFLLVYRGYEKNRQPR
jgi:hypothetical protein